MTKAAKPPVEKPTPLNSFTVCASKEGGYSVWSPDLHYREMGPVALFSGGLTECLAFIRRRITPDTTIRQAK